MRACETLLRAGEDQYIIVVFFEINHRGFLVGTKYGFGGVSIKFSPKKHLHPPTNPGQL